MIGNFTQFRDLPEIFIFFETFRPLQRIRRENHLKLAKEMLSVQAQKGIVRLSP